MNFFILSSLLFLASFGSSELLIRSKRGGYMSSYNRPSYENQYNPYQNQYNPYQNWNNDYHYQNNYGQSNYNRPSSYGPPVSSYGRPSYPTSSYNRPTSSYGRPPQMYPQQPQQPPVVGSIEPNVDEVPVTLAPVPPTPLAPTDVYTTTPSGPLFGGVEAGSGTMSPGGELPPPPPTDEEMTQVNAAEKENEVRKTRGGSRGGPPGINVDSIVETGTLPPQAAIPDIPDAPPSA